MHTTLLPTLSKRYLPNLSLLARNTALVMLGSVWVALLAQLRLPLPFTPVPVTGQTLAVLLVGAALGPRLGSASLALYLAMGMAGLPVFTGGGNGLSHLAGPTGGYLLGFVAAAFLVGKLAERGLERSWKTALLPFLAGQAIIYLCGISWLAVYVGGLEKAITLGALPFLAGDALKLALAALLLPAAWKLAQDD